MVAQLVLKHTEAECLGVSDGAGENFRFIRFSKHYSLFCTLKDAISELKIL